jgi:hypothetical protein
MDAAMLIEFIVPDFIGADLLLLRDFVHRRPDCRRPRRSHRRSDSDCPR